MTSRRNFLRATAGCAVAGVTPVAVYETPVATRLVIQSIDYETKTVTFEWLKVGDDYLYDSMGFRKV